MNNNNYYVYEWYNVETDEVFYVGKGRGRRNKTTTGRNDYFTYYINKHNCDVRLVETNMSNEDALLLEAFLIKEYKSKGWAKTNLTEGGENPPVLSGSANGMYGKKHTEETRQKISLKNKDGKFAGENNPQHGISPQDRMDNDTYIKWKNNHKKSLSGENNPQYGVSPKNRMDNETYNQWLIKQTKRKTGPTNPNAKPVFMYNKDYSFLSKFDFIEDCVSWLFSNNKIKAKNRQSVRNGIWKSIKYKKTYSNYFFSFELL